MKWTRERGEEADNDERVYRSEDGRHMIVGFYDHGHVLRGGSGVQRGWDWNLYSASDGFNRSDATFSTLREAKAAVINATALPS